MISTAEQGEEDRGTCTAATGHVAGLPLKDEILYMLYVTSLRFAEKFSEAER
jgi:hypothetical protein